LTYADELLVLSTDRGLFYTAQTNVIRGFCLTALGHPDEGIPLLSSALADYRAGANALHIPLFLTMLADAERMAGQVDAGLAHIDEALTMLDATDEKWGEAEILRVRGELLHISGDQLSAEASFRGAIARSERQGAKLFELRACTSLARLWRHRGDRTQALQLLAPVYAWFTEGFNAVDLVEARRLLDELAGSSPPPEMEAHRDRLGTSSSMDSESWR
jgi:predicted ATPase